MENNFFKLLLTKISEGKASDEDLMFYQRWYERQLLEEITQEELDAAKSGVTEEIFMRVQKVIDCEDVDNSESKRKIISPLWKRWLASAAAVLIFIGLWMYYLHNQKPIQIIHNDYKQVNFDTTQGVILKLANGDKIDLTSTSNDKINQLTDKNVVKGQDVINYDMSSNDSQTSHEKLTKEVFNTVYTPAGKTFQIVLEDGTKVWLNAKSMLRFPVNFVGNQRRVQLIGEGYFEVVSNAAKPFVVESKGQEVIVHGTKFNIDAYEDAISIKSTLFEGRVDVINRNSNERLNLVPGDQAVLSNTTFKKNRVLLKNVLGWKNGYFVFHNERFETICNTLSRWYNVEFDYSKNPRIINQIFSGTVGKLETVDDVLAVLSETGTIKYKREGRRIILMN